MLVTGLLICCYVLGSIPFSFLIVKLLVGTDIRDHGSRNVGATNVARTAGRVAGIVALLLDLAKGYGAAELAGWVTRQPAWPLGIATDAFPLHSRAFWIALCGLVAVLGHMFPVWLRFRGGKGVATATGVFLAIDPIAVAAGAIIFLMVITSTRFVSLASMLGAASIPLFLRFLTHAPFWSIIVSIVIAMAVILKHHANIARLAHGTEPRVGEKKR